MNKFDIPTQLDAINFHNTHDTLSVPKGMTLKQLVEDYDRLNNIINELEKWLKQNIKESQEYDKKHRCEWQGYNFYIELLDKLKELKGKNND
jgi:hypothetical protein